jgi:DNA replication protein DnaC
MPKILILSSNPRRDLNLDREVSYLIDALQRFGTFELRFGFGARPEDLQRKITEHRPQIVHFCGHGAGKDGLVFQSEGGQEQFVSTETLAQVFKIFANEINCAILNACDSDHQALAITEHINYAIGMRQPILDEAAHCFAVGFYEGLATGSSIEQAYELGCLAIKIWLEKSSQSNRSRQDRRLEYVGSVVDAAEPSLTEDMKPVLRKKSSLSTSNPKQAVPPLSLSAVRLQEFTEYIKQEIDRKEYKVQARAAYDNFGLYSAQNASEKGVEITKAEHKQRQILLNKVKLFWIEGFLKPSLHNFPNFRLDLKACPDAIADIFKGIEALSVKLDTSYDTLRSTQIYQELGRGRTLLILGEPGAGKTIALLQLAERLVERSEVDPSLPIPVIFNLSSWAKEQKKIFDWLIDELQEKYQVPKELSDFWIKEQQLIFLLDGLDEVEEKHRNDCVHALNKFIGLFPQTEVAVCSRVKDYEALTERLQISSALCLQPLSSEQVYLSLDKADGSLAGLKMLLKSDSELEKFACNPLILNFMTVAYWGWSVEKLMHEFSSVPDRNQHLFNTYTDCRLERGTASEYSNNKVLRWLSWLASQMLREKQTIFLIEKMQPAWLKNRQEARGYRIRSSVIGGFLFALFWALIGGLIDGLNNMLMDILLLGLISILIIDLSREVSPLEKLSWSWQQAKSNFARELITGVLTGVTIGVIVGLMIWLHALLVGLFLGKSGKIIGVILRRPVILITGSIFGVIVGLIFLMGSGLGASKIDERKVPNQGIRFSLGNSLIIGLLFGFIFELPFLLISLHTPKLSSGLIFGLIFGLIAMLKYGGAACIQHFTLRRMLYKKGRIPWNYAKFLDFAADRLLMKKVGGGYVFFHRMLLEHFANMGLS